MTDLGRNGLTRLEHLEHLVHGRSSLEGRQPIGSCPQAFRLLDTSVIHCGIAVPAAIKSLSNAARNPDSVQHAGEAVARS
jgi:hypothetical protein